MPNRPMLDQTVFTAVNEAEERIESELGCDVIYFYGDIRAACVNDFRSLIEDLAQTPTRKKALSICLTTFGGEVEVVEKLAEISRHHYPDEVNFIVPSAAFSAGTVFCMSGDRIFMDYSSSLGPIDPQVPDREDQFLVPALGYLDKVEELIQKSLDDRISPAEMATLLKLDLAVLRLYEQARDLSVELIRKWLVQYKFKNWKRHQTTNVGAEVTLAEKEARAEEIAAKLSSNRIWHSHGRMIGMNTLRSVLRLQIDDFGSDREFARTVRIYSDTLGEYLQRHGFDFFLYNRRVEF
jgi:membrane-bound ClpP family serine protease